MERESFEDEEVAQVLNDHFVAVKVDREERPDVDHIYMMVCQALTGSGGWPLTVVMTPDKKPFFAGAYFPKHNRYGRPGLLSLLEGIREQWRNNREQLVAAGQRISEAVQPGFQGKSRGPLTEDTLREGYLTLKKLFDPVYGGFGEAPKFPTPHNLSFLLRYWKHSGQKEALAMVEETLQSMADGGIYDHLGYGFSRYSVDRKWLVPHFEKMLYDNALLAIAYLEAYQATGKEAYARTVREIFTYVLRDMTSPEGGFYSAEDADSEGKEGKFYLWSPEEIKEVLGEELGDRVCRWYHVTAQGNFEGKNILHRIHPNKQSFESEEDWPEILEKAKERLFLAREKRIHPRKDDKILTAWNGLMIAALALGYRVLRDDAYREAAVKAAGFIGDKLINAEGRLLARYRDGEAAFPAYLDDYAYLIWAMIELYQADHDPRWLKGALELQEAQNRLFWDEEDGGYFFYGSDGEELLARPKEIYDGASPSGNSVSALNLLRLARLTGKSEYEDLANRLMESFSGNVNGYPAGHTHLLMALLFALSPAKEVVVVSPKAEREVSKELAPLAMAFAPDTVFLYRLGEEDYGSLEEIAPFVKDMVPKGNATTFYICQDFACQQPVNDISAVTRML